MRLLVANTQTTSWVAIATPPSSMQAVSLVRNSGWPGARGPRPWLSASGGRPGLGGACARACQRLPRARVSLPAAAINLARRFPHFERLYIKVTHCSKVCTHQHFWSICIIHTDDDGSNARLTTTVPVLGLQGPSGDLVVTAPLDHV